MIHAPTVPQREELRDQTATHPPVTPRRTEVPLERDCLAFSKAKPWGLPI